MSLTERSTRWLASVDLKFPRPMIVNRRRYFFLYEIEEWERAQARKECGRAA